MIPNGIRKPSRIQFDHKDLTDAPAIGRTINRIQDSLSNAVNQLVSRANNPGPQVVTALDVVSGVLPIGASASEVRVASTSVLTKILGALSVTGLATLGGGSTLPGTVSAAASTLSTVHAAYITTTAQSIPNATFTVVNYGTLETDTDAAVITGTSWHFTCPANKGGLYQVHALAALNPATYTGALVLAIRKNGSGEVAEACQALIAAGTAGRESISVSTVLRLVAGDTVDVLLYQSSGAAAPLYTQSFSNRISITRVPGS